MLAFAPYLNIGDNFDIIHVYLLLSAVLDMKNLGTL